MSIIVSDIMRSSTALVILCFITYISRTQSSPFSVPYEHNDDDYERIYFGDHTDIVTTQPYYNDTNGVPLSVLEKIKDVKSTSEFLEKFVNFPELKTTSIPGSDRPIDPREDSADSLFNSGVDDGPRLAAAHSSRFAPADIAPLSSCEVRLTPVRFPQPTEHRVIYFPACTDLPRCGGGCCTGSHDLHKCKPTADGVRTKTLKVLKVRYSGNEERPFTHMKQVDLPVEMHTSCQCSCRITPDQCSSTLHVYEGCQCRCRNVENSKHCGKHGKVWHNNKCRCVCRHVHNCPARYYYSHVTCRCERQFGSPGSSFIDRDNDMTDEGQEQQEQTSNFASTGVVYVGDSRRPSLQSRHHDYDRILERERLALMYEPPPPRPTPRALPVRKTFKSTDSSSNKVYGHSNTMRGYRHALTSESSPSINSTSPDNAYNSNHVILSDKEIKYHERLELPKVLP